MHSFILCCLGRTQRKKVDPVQRQSSSEKETRPSKVLRSPSRLQARPRREEKVRFHVQVDQAYKIYSAIGKGAFGHVMRAEHKESRKPYAIKMIELNKNGDSYEKKSEIEILRTVDHPFVIKLHDVITTPRKLYLVMDLATGGELFDRIYQVGSFSESDARRVLKMMLEGLQYLHSVGITHRDLKPENILYYHPGHDSKIIITDFGLAAIRKCPTEELMRTDCGTIEYMAPEIIVRDPYTNAVDMWSTGVITFILLSGKLPFPIEKNLYSVLRSICLGRYSFEGEPWDKISSEAKTFISSLLVNDQTKRMTASGALQHVWMKKRQPKKKNLQRSISSNWTESCLSLNSKFLSNGSITKLKTEGKKTPLSATQKSRKPTHGSIYDFDQINCEKGTKLESAGLRPASCKQPKCCQTIHVGEKCANDGTEKQHCPCRVTTQTKQYHTLSDGIERREQSVVRREKSAHATELPPLNNPSTPLLARIEGHQCGNVVKG